MQENTDRDLGKTSEEILNECMVISALQSTELALEAGLRPDQIIISCKVSRPRDLIAVYRELAQRTDQPLHLGLTEAGMGIKGLVWSASAMGMLLARRHRRHDPRLAHAPPGGDRREEVYAACEILQSLGLRSFAPVGHRLPRLRPHHLDHLPGTRRAHPGLRPRTACRLEDRARRRRRDHLAVMGCVVNGPGESKAANIGISLPGTGEAPTCPVYIDGQKFTTLHGTYPELSAAFEKIVDDYVATKYTRKA